MGRTLSNGFALGDGDTWRPFTPVLRNQAGAVVTLTVGTLFPCWYAITGNMAWINLAFGGFAGNPELQLSATADSFLVDFPAVIPPASNALQPSGIVGLVSGFASITGVPETMIMQVNGGESRVQLYRAGFAVWPAAPDALVFGGQIWFPI